MIFAQGNVFMHNVYDTVISHKASLSLERNLHHLFPSLDINLLLNAIEKCRRMYMDFLTAVYNKIYNEYIWWEIIFRTKACFMDIRAVSAHICHIFCSRYIEVYSHTCSSTYLHCCYYGNFVKWVPGCLFTWIGSICYVGQYDLIAHIWSSVTPCMVWSQTLVVNWQN